MTMAATLTCASAAPGSDELLTAMTGAIPSAMDAASYKEHFTKIREMQTKALEQIAAMGKWSLQRQVLGKPLEHIKAKLTEGKEAYMALVASVDPSASAETLELDDEGKTNQFKAFSATIENVIFLSETLLRFPASRRLMDKETEGLFFWAYAYATQAAIGDENLDVLLNSAKQVMELDIDAIPNPDDNASGTNVPASDSPSPAKKKKRAKKTKAEKAAEIRKRKLRRRS
ncbi:uncharacterized protein AMSG_02544 [Thecamonas trahens ATCC 50062]|uniref:Uncharacterized protein n=1 Tax=Thecamonas trahens ATCC 50062 TaxID=461836 RepID=A0A0L0D5A4_THETB|nr:hypothetical protein AMSG_02544 [Thecamonas trahens ATCC 50062]KNC47524.1 hypothetical protein AMSG_02544 [Thecamonas trahens ATCC 50062]|eukprot:XP_013759458.1 hypothetical protein AMSG_02544 [Thecamonas trahens ATCC 50062]